MKRLAEEIVSRMPQLTVQRSASKALENARLNLPYVDRTITDLTSLRACNGRNYAIVIAAGPSLHRKNPAIQILKSGCEGQIISTDGGLGYCLRNGLVPDYVMTLDPHPSRICRWFGDPELESRFDDDDYFRRQDLDPYVGVRERERNRELIDLVNRHGPKIKVAICTSISPNVARRCIEAGVKLYWWNPILDDIDDPKSITRKLYNSNKVPCMVSGGNGGSAAWVFAHQVLESKDVALVGMDLGYPPGTPLENTQYYKELWELFGERATDAFISVYNPYLKETWYADPAYYWYRQTFLQMASRARCITYNCTEGGIVFGKGVKFITLNKFFASRERTGNEG